MRKKLPVIEYLWSLALLVRDAWYWLVPSVFAAGSPMLLTWRYIQMMAANMGWWVYPIIGLLFTAATLGIFSLILIITKKVKVLDKRDVAVAKDTERARGMATKAVQLSQDILELLADYRPMPPTHPDFNGDDGSEKTWRAAPDAWQRRNFDIRNTLYQKYMAKYHTQCMGLLKLAAPYSAAASAAANRFSWHFSEHDVEIMPGALLDVAVELVRSLTDQGEDEPHQLLLGIEESKRL